MIIDESPNVGRFKTCQCCNFNVVTAKTNATSMHMKRNFIDETGSVSFISLVIYDSCCLSHETSFCYYIHIQMNFICAIFLMKNVKITIYMLNFIHAKYHFQRCNTADITIAVVFFMFTGTIFTYNYNFLCLILFNLFNIYTA